MSAAAAGERKDLVMLFKNPACLRAALTGSNMRFCIASMQNLSMFW